MPGFKQGDVVRVPFPYTDRTARQHRPAVVVASSQLEAEHGLLWILMVTSAENRGWPGDVVINNLQTAGLPIPSVIRTAKIATIEAADAGKLGRLTPATLKLALSHVQAALEV